MTSAVRQLLGDSRRQFVLLDSNLLLLHVTSLYDPQLLMSFKRVQMFPQNDAVLLEWLLDQFAGVATTAHVLTEASNLGNSLSYVARDGWFAALADFAAEADEAVSTCVELSQAEEFCRYGVTDAALSQAPRRFTVLTNDGRLASHLLMADKQVINFRTIQLML